MKALALFSGGLDSMIAVKLLTMQNIEVLALHVDIGFGSRTDTRELMQKRAFMAGADFEIMDAKEMYLKNILFDPKYGYGKNFNPCIDCHGFMFKNAINMLDEFKASFLVTGEVVGQRPMSQRSDALKSVQKLAGDEEGLILRPLSAKIMEPTKPEKKGWVDREKLLGISGRGREIQLSLAKEFGWDDFEKPGGGCLLTDINFTKKINDFIKYDKMAVEDIEVLKNGRHLRLPNGAKLIIGRDKNENNRIENIEVSKYTFLKAPQVPGPSSLISKNATKEDMELAIRIVLTFAKTQTDKEYEVKVGNTILKAKPFESREGIYKYFIT